MRWLVVVVWNSSKSRFDFQFFHANNNTPNRVNIKRIIRGRVEEEDTMTTPSEGRYERGRGKGRS